MTLADAKIILATVLDKEITDSLIYTYELRDSLQTSTITLQLESIRLLQLKCKNQDLIIENLNKLINNKDSEIGLLNDTIKKQKKEIRKQKFLKFLGYTGSIVLPIVTLFIIIGIK